MIKPLDGYYLDLQEIIVFTSTNDYPLKFVPIKMSHFIQIYQY